MSTLPLVLMTHTLPADWIVSLEGKCQIVKGPIDATEMDITLYEHLAEAQALFTLLTIQIGKNEIDQAPNMRVISNMAVGVDNIDIATCTQRRIPVGNTPGVLTEGTADLAMALLLAAARGLPQASLDAREGRWKTWSPTGWLGKDLNGATIGIVGMGKIGGAVAKRAMGFGMHVVYYDPQTKDISQAESCSFEDVLKKSDFISLHVPLNSQTHHLMNQQAFDLMRSDAILVNASRGSVVDTDALYKALLDKRIAGAALDVTDPEPLPPDHPLLTLQNCLVVPHIGSATRNTRRHMAELACENLLAGLQGRRLPYCVNPEVYERQS